MKALNSIIARVRAFDATPAGQQVWRFIRLGAMSAAAVWLADGHELTWAALSAAGVAGAETVYRAVLPVVSAKLDIPKDGSPPVAGV